jgi:hypothetical protein
MQHASDRSEMNIIFRPERLKEEGWIILSRDNKIEMDLSIRWKDSQCIRLSRSNNRGQIVV